MIQAAGFGLAYMLVAGATIATTRFNGGVAFLWVATALLVGRLATLPRREWPPILVAAMAGNAVATWTVGIGSPAALPLAFVNMSEAVLATLLMQRGDEQEEPFGSLGWLGRFIAAAGVVAPLASGLPGAVVAAVTTGKPFLSTWMHWFAGHALGTLAFAPIALLLFRGELRRWLVEASRRQLIECGLLLLLVAATSLLVFSQRSLPMTFLPLLPIILATFRADRIAAAVSVVVLTICGITFTLQGQGPMSLVPMPLGEQLQFVQFYLAATVLTVLPIATDLARRKELFRALADSEARYRILADNSTDIILNLDVDGRIRFASPSIRRLGDLDPVAMVGRNAADLVHPDDRPHVMDAHRAALGSDGDTVAVEYRATTASGEMRWFEMHSRAVRNRQGEVEGAVSVIRDVSARKAVEVSLSRAADTDPLTQLPNRRGFFAALARIVAERGGGPAGCLAMLDLDWFKRVNDLHGHAAGDRVLQDFARIARGALRSGDLLARLGGEEFVAILPGASIDQAAAVCERLRGAIAAYRFDVGTARIGVTVSGGVAPILADPDAALHAADAALYAAKAAGRNRLSLAA